MSRIVWPLEDLSDVPDDWLEAHLTLVDEGSNRDPDDHFVASIEAIFRKRDIERREGRRFFATGKNAQAEKLRREGKLIPVERDQVYEGDGSLWEIGRISFKGGWFQVRPAGTDEPLSKRRLLPLPADWRLAGWTH